METSEAYHNGAFICITLFCAKCHATLDSNDLPKGQPRFKEDGWYLALGDEAFRLGWLVNEDDDFRALCPQCAKENADT